MKKYVEGKKAGKLSILTLNMGFNVMSNSPAGTEAPMVKYCQIVYPDHDGWTWDKKMSKCTSNAVDIIAQSDLIGLQEVNISMMKPFLEAVEKKGKEIGKNFQFIKNGSGWAVVTIFDQNKIGDGIQITPDGFSIGDVDGKEIDRRPMQLTYFPRTKILFVNLHAPHRIDLKRSIEDALKGANPYLTQMGIGRKDIGAIFITGDFNDWKGHIVEDEFGINISGRTIVLPVKADKIPKTCCADSNYKFTGDHILIDDVTLKKIDVEYYGVPKGFHRYKRPVSDHDPLVAILKIF